jgi:hypothetical protein
MLHRPTNAALFALVMFTAACAVPLGPGFFIDKEILEVHFVPGAPPRLEVRATFTLKNTGNAPLDALDLSLPNEKDSGKQSLSITIDGAAVSPQSSSDAAPLRISFPAAWAQKSKHTLVVSYLLASSAAGQHFGLSENSFYLSAPDWFPLPRAPKGLLSEGDKPPKVFDVSVVVPQDFLVRAAGLPRGTKRRSAETEFRFRLREDEPSRFVVAGRYHELKFSDANGAICFWTFSPLSQGPAPRLAAQLTASLRAYEKAFGPLGKRAAPVYVVESATRLDRYRGRTFPGGVLVEPADLANNDFADAAQIFLARLWFGQLLKPEVEADVLLGPAAASYATSVGVESAGSRDRNAAIASLLRNFKSDPTAAPVQLLTNPKVPESPQQRLQRIYKGTLFYYALEDECGKEAVHRALSRMMQARRNYEAGINDLRSALEAESGKDLGEFFRLWLNQPGIPADFRARYAKAP